MNASYLAIEQDYQNWQKAMDEGRIYTGDFILARLQPALLDALPGLLEERHAAERLAEVVEKHLHHNFPWNGREMTEALRAYQEARR